MSTGLEPRDFYISCFLGHQARVCSIVSGGKQIGSAVLWKPKQAHVHKHSWYCFLCLFCIKCLKVQPQTEFCFPDPRSSYCFCATIFLFVVCLPCPQLEESAGIPCGMIPTSCFFFSQPCSVTCHRANQEALSLSSGTQRTWRHPVQNWEKVDRITIIKIANILGSP